MHVGQINVFSLQNSRYSGGKKSTLFRVDAQPYRREKDADRFPAAEEKPCQW